MAWTEDSTSREFQMSDEGVTFTRIFSVPWADWNDSAVFASYYNIGSSLLADGEFTVNPYKLYVKWVYNSGMTPTYTKVNVLYSTKESRAAMKKQPDQVGSWEESFDIGTEVMAIPDTYEEYNTTTHLWEQKSWESAYSAVYNLPVPELTLHIPLMNYTLTAYSEKLYIKRIFDNLGKINSNKFMEDYFAFDQGSGIITDIPSGYDDADLWLFESCPIRRVRYDCWEHQFNFRLCPGITHGDTWQTPHGITCNQYQRFNFSTLLNGMRGTETLSLPVQA